MLAMLHAVSSSLLPVFTAWSLFSACAKKCGRSGTWDSTSAAMTCHSQPSRHICFKSSFFCTILSNDKCPLVLNSASGVLQEAKTALRKVTRWLLETDEYLSHPMGPHNCSWESSAKDLFTALALSFACGEVGSSKQTDSPILAIEKPICAIAAPLLWTSATDTSCPPRFWVWTSIILGSMLCL